MYVHLIHSSYRIPSPSGRAATSESGEPRRKKISSRTGCQFQGRAAPALIAAVKKTPLLIALDNYLQLLSLQLLSFIAHCLLTIYL